jgi:hypothetical protein
MTGPASAWLLSRPCNLCNFVVTSDFTGVAYTVMPTAISALKG